MSYRCWPTSAALPVLYFMSLETHLQTLFNLIYLNSPHSPSGVQACGQHAVHDEPAALLLRPAGHSREGCGPLLRDRLSCQLQQWRDVGESKRPRSPQIHRSPSWDRKQFPSVCQQRDSLIRTEHVDRWKHFTSLQGSHQAASVMDLFTFTGLIMLLLLLAKHCHLMQFPLVSA